MAVLSRNSNIVTLLKQHVIGELESLQQCQMVVLSHQQLPLLATRFLNTYKIVVGGRLRSIFPPCPNIRSLCIAAHLYMCGHSMLCIHVICSELLFL
ncbi:unnamed protein product [Sphagnum balticum]